MSTHYSWWKDTQPTNSRLFNVQRFRHKCSKRIEEPAHQLYSRSSAENSKFFVSSTGGRDSPEDAEMRNWRIVAARSKHPDSPILPNPFDPPPAASRSPRNEIGRRGNGTGRKSEDEEIGLRKIGVGIIVVVVAPIIGGRLREGRHSIGLRRRREDEACSIGGRVAIATTTNKEEKAEDEEEKDVFCLLVGWLFFEELMPLSTKKLQQQQMKRELLEKKKMVKMLVLLEELCPLSLRR